MSYVVVKGLIKSYPTKSQKKREPLLVLDRISLEIEKGELFVIFGPNACGKSTLLNILAGILDYDDGQVSIGNKSPSNANVGYVFQNFRESLLPWRNCLENIKFPLELKGVKQIEQTERVKSFLSKFGIQLPLESFPYQLSGGQQQLISIIRAFVIEPDVLLMDEPFNGLDYSTRIDMYRTLLHIWGETKVAILLVSHDIEEAIFLSNRLAILSQRPAKVKKILQNNLPWPRNRNTVGLEAFSKLQVETIRIFQKEVIEK